MDEEPVEKDVPRGGLRDAEWRAAHPVQSAIVWGSVWGGIVTALGAKTVGSLAINVCGGIVFFGPIAVWLERRKKKRDAQQP